MLQRVIGHNRQGVVEGETTMPKMVTGERLREAVERQTFIQGGDPICAEGVKYDFRLSARILKAKFGRPIDASLVAPDELFIEPGEMVFAMSEERLSLPANVVAELSPSESSATAGYWSLAGSVLTLAIRGDC